MNDIVITGSTGVAGRRAVRELLGAGHRVSGVTRSARGREQLEGLGARAGQAAGVRRLVQESIAFVYADGGEEWLEEDAPAIGGGVTTTALTAERNAHELFGGDTVVLRFGLFLGPDGESSQAALEAARGGTSVAAGPPDAYQPTVWLDDAASAIAAAVGVAA